MKSLNEISCADVFKISQKNPNFKIVDVRTPEEFAQVHASIAKNIPLDAFSAQKVKDLGFNKSDAIYIICRSGARSATACAILQNDGFENAINILGGTLDWVSSGFPSISNE